MEIKTLSVSCPTCKTQVLMTQDFAHRPFCSKRCQLIDFGGWVNEDHKIKGESFDEFDSQDEDDENLY